MALRFDTDVSKLDQAFNHKPGVIAFASPSEFIEDENNPRIEHSIIKEFDEDIKQRGILQPLVVIKDNKTNKLKIRFGARRYRAALRLKLKQIPYVITEDARQFDDYSQVAENEFRENLTPLELAKFIDRKIKEGDTKTKIAQNLHKDASAVTHYLALIDAPVFILKLYESHKCRTPKYLYTLRNLYNQNGKLTLDMVSRALSIDKTFLDNLEREIANYHKSEKNANFSDREKSTREVYLTERTPEEPKKEAEKQEEEVKQESNNEPEVIEEKEKEENKANNMPKIQNDEILGISKNLDQMEASVLKKKHEVPKGKLWKEIQSPILIGRCQGMLIEIITYMQAVDASHLIIRPLELETLLEVRAETVQIICLYEPK